MAGAAFEVSFNDSAILGVLDRLAAGLAEQGPLLRTLGAYGVDSSRRRFETQASPEGTPWAGLNTAYASFKATMGGSPDILRWSGDLMNSLHFRTEPSEVLWGSGMIYAAVHQFGAIIVPVKAKALRFRTGLGGAIEVVARSVTIPARPYLGISLEDQAEIVLLTEDYLRGLISGA